jgi:hypothetical protein
MIAMYELFDNFSDDFLDEKEIKQHNKLAIQGNMTDWGIEIPTSTDNKIRVNYARITIHYPNSDESFNIASDRIRTAAHALIIPLPAFASQHKEEMRIRIEVFTRSLWIGISRKYLEYNFGLNMA